MKPENTKANQTSTERKQRFFRDGPPYFKDFELVLSQLFGKHGEKQQELVNIVVELLKELNNHLGDCHAILGKTENLIEEHRARKGSQEDIERLASICMDLQRAETQVAESMKSCTNKIVDMVFPR